MSYKFFTVDLAAFIATVSFNRPEKANALHRAAWLEMKHIFEALDEDAAVRVIILKGVGKHWCAGIDLELLMSIAQISTKDEARKRERIRKEILFLQECINAIEHCNKPVLAAIHNGCIGGGVDIATACDIRYCTQDAYFSIRETDLGLVADIGTLQRLPKLIPAGKAYEMAYTARKVAGAEAERIGLVNTAFIDQEHMDQAVQQIAEQIAAKSPIVLRGIKENIRYSREHNTQDALHHVATYNAAFMLSNDLMEAFQAYLQKRAPEFKEE